MQTNCKPGDLAYVVAGSPTPGLSGRVVRVVRRAMDNEKFMSVHGYSVRFRDTDGFVPWVCEASLPIPWAHHLTRAVTLMLSRPIGDQYLRPLRDSDGEDETLTWAGKPQALEVA